MGIPGHTPVPYMDEVELADEGFVLEANRQFFHPLGLCLVLQMTADGGFRLRVLDHRDLPAGLRFHADEDADVLERRRRKVANVGRLWEERGVRRLSRYGQIVQPAAELWTAGRVSKDEEGARKRPELFDA